MCFVLQDIFIFHFYKPLNPDHQFGYVHFLQHTVNYTILGYGALWIYCVYRTRAIQYLVPKIVIHRVFWNGSTKYVRLNTLILLLLNGKCSWHKYVKVVENRFSVQEQKELEKIQLNFPFSFPSEVDICKMLLNCRGNFVKLFVLQKSPRKVCNVNGNV